MSELKDISDIRPALLAHYLACWATEPAEIKRVSSFIAGDKSRALRARAFAVVSYDRAVDAMIKGVK